MAIYINNTDTKAGRQSGIHLESMVRYLFTTKNGLLFLLSQLITIPIAVQQHWSGSNIVFYYTLYSFFTLIASLVLALVWHPKGVPANEAVYFNGQKTQPASRLGGVFIILLFFAPALLISFSLSPQLFVMLRTGLPPTMLLLPLYQAGVLIYTFVKMQKQGLNDGIDLGDVTGTFTFMLSPYFRLGAINFLLNGYMIERAAVVNPVTVLLVIGLAESLIHALGFAKGALPLTVKQG